MLLRRITHIIGFASIIMLILLSCSTEKDAGLNRWFHQTNTKYNGYFNANELVKQGMNNFYISRTEDFTTLLPIEPLPNDEEAQAMYSILDTAISKCERVIALHSMPSIATGRKTDEYNKWMDDVWLVIGKSKYIERKYEDAFKNFEYIRKFFKGNPASLWGSLWIAKTHIQVGEIRKAEMLLKKIDRDMEQIKKKNEESKSGGGKERSKSKLIRKLNRGKNDSEEGGGKPMKLDKDFEYELLKTKAALAIINEKYTDAQKFLHAALEKARFKNRKEKPRLNYILAQLSRKNGDVKSAIKSYTKVVKSPARYDMVFSARINRAMAAGSIGKAKIRKELNKMLRDSKNFEFKDQIYYALGDIEMSAGNRDLAIQNFTKSVYFSINNNRQKGLSYERMGNIFFKEKNYLKAQKYYDSCVNTVSEDKYKNYAVVKNKADKLKDLAVALETVALEDSLQRIAKLSPDEQKKFLKNVIKQIKEERQRQKEAAALRLAQLQEIQNRNSSGGGGGKWYFYDKKQRDKGYQDFKSIWGQRQLEDDWRRSNKVETVTFTEEDTTTSADSSLVITQPAKDSLSVDLLLSKIPNSDSALSASKERLMNALYVSGKLYHTDLHEDKLAIGQFTDLIGRNIESPNNLLAIYQLYNIYKPIDNAKSDYYKNMLLNNYPNSDYANYIRDPEYFLKQKEREKIDLENYLKSIERYNLGLYSLVQAKSKMIIDNEPENPYRSKYMLLHVLAKGHYTTNKQDLLPDLNKIVKEFPNTDEAKKAKEMIDIIKNGYSKAIDPEFADASKYEYNPNEPVFLVIMLGKNAKVSEVKTNVSNFNREFFSLEHYKTQATILPNKAPIILIREFENDMVANKYLDKFGRTKKYNIDGINAYKKFLISNTNYALLISTSDLKGYLNFYKDFYQ